jgi:hypothetical protein
MIIYSYRWVLSGIILVMLAFLFTGCSKTNNVPTLEISIEDSTPLPGSSQTLTAVVTDQDTADIISVTWDISEGNPYAATGLSIEYTAPGFETVDTIRVEANDQNGGIVTETIIMFVTNGSPQIESYTVNQAAVLLGNEVTLTVTASDPESLPLTYHFSSSGNVGIFVNHEPEDSIAIWEAPFNPDLAEEYDLYVTVSDSLGKSTSDTLSVIVYSEHGTMWVVDSGLKSVRKYDEDGNYILSAEESFDYPVAIANNHPDWFGCWVADNGLGKIVEIDEDGSTIQTYDNLSNITDIDYHENTGTICALSRANKTLTLIIGTEVKTIYGFQSPNSIVVNQISDEVLVSDYGHQQIIAIDLLPEDGVYPDTVSSEHYLDQLNGVLNGPVAIAITNYTNQTDGVMILVADYLMDRIERIKYTFGYNYESPITGITKPVALATTANYTWYIEDDGAVGYFDTFDASSPNIIALDELINTKPRVITGDYLKDAVWIGDNTTNTIIKARYLNGDIVNEASITVINFVEDIVVNR